MTEAPKNPGSLADFEASGDFESPQAAQKAFFEKVHEFRLEQADYLGVDEDDLHAMRFER